MKSTKKITTPKAPQKLRMFSVLYSCPGFDVPDAWTTSGFTRRGILRSFWLNMPPKLQVDVWAVIALPDKPNAVLSQRPAGMGDVR